MSSFGLKLFKLSSLAFLLTVFGLMNGRAQSCGCTFTIPAGTGTYAFDGAAKGAKPGDVICLTSAGVIERINFTNLTGSPTNYIIIKNCGGQSLVGGPNANTAIQFLRSKYFRITGTGDAGYKHGIKIIESKKSSQGLQALDLSTDFEIDHLEVTKTGFAGIMTKSDPSKDCSVYTYERPNFIMKNVSIHDNYVHNIGGEGIYCGNSFYRGSTIYCGDRIQYSHEVRGVRIFNNVFESCGWESIQVGAGVNDIEIHDNKIYDYGTKNVSSQNGGIQCGEGTSAKVYNNFIKGGTGKAIFVQGIGNNFVYNNVLVNSGTASIQVSMLATPLTTDIVSQGFVGPVRIMNNTIINPSTIETVKESLVGPLGNVMYNNLIVGGPSKWLKLRGDTDWKTGNNLYIPLLADAKFTNPASDDYSLLSGSPAINAGFSTAVFGVTSDFANKSRPSGAAFDVGAFEYGGKIKPTVSVGANQSITLPTVTTTITGSATDADGAVISYVWTKQGGPLATLVNANTPILSLSGLLVGVYTFRLTATDNDGEQGFGDVTVTVVDPSVNQPPVANTGGNKTIKLPVSTTVLSGSASDVDGTVVSYSWTKISALAAVLTNSNSATLTLTGLVEGVHTFRLTVTDDDGDVDFKDATVTVQAAAANQAPNAIAGSDKNLTLPTNSVNLVGSGNDPDGTIAGYSWSKQSGPAVTLGTTTNSTLSLTGLPQGTYVFRLTVTDDKGVTGFDEATVTVSAANQIPTANAGGNKTIQLPTNSTTLSGSGSDPDGTITTYLWAKVSGPASGTLSNVGNPTLTLTNLVQGDYIFRLTVTDNSSATNTNDITLKVQAANLPPTADAGPAKTLILPVNATNLVGSGSDIDGFISLYFWEKVSGPATMLSDTNLPTLSLTNLTEGSYSFRLTVTDNLGVTGSSLVSVVVFPASTNQSPVVDIGDNVTLTLPANSTTLVGSASDPDGTISFYLWEKVNGPTATLNGTATNSLSLSNLIAGSYLFRLTVTDNKGSTASDDVNVIVTNSNQKPLVNAGDNQLITLPTASASMLASASDPDGTISTYSWTLFSGPTSPALSGASTNTLSVVGLIAGTYVFRITVTDNLGATNFDDVNVVVQTPGNVNPIANAGSAINLFLPTNSVTITGSASDSDGTIASYSWTQTSGTAVTLSNQNTNVLTVSNLIAGTFSFRLTATDNAGGTGLSDVNVTVNSAATNQPPVADAGPTIALTLPVNSTNLIGSGSDADGTISTYNWTKVSGPSVTLANENTAVLSIQDLQEGIYIFKLTVTDNNGSPSSDDTQVTVLPSSVNQTPSVNAGNDVTITLPNNTVNLTAAASDLDGSISAYVWSKQIGPTASLSGEGSSVLSVTDLIEGTYTFRVSVIDNLGSTTFDEVNIIVLPLGSNQPPIVNAGNNKILFLPNNSVNLDGQASDTDGSIATYLWTKKSGPSVTLTNDNKTTVTLNDLLAGQYVFRLTATDNSGAASFDEVTVTIFPGTVNQAPVANAGSNQTIVSPNTSTSLSGSGFDPDGSIVSYTWTQKSGPTCTIDNINSPTLLINDLTVGVFQFQLTVQDDDGSTGSDLALITVVEEGFNLPPIADAGFDKVVNLPQNSVDIQGDGSDPDGTIATFNWIKKSGPSAVNLSGQTTSKLSLSGLVAGTYQFTLTVFDNNGLSNSDDVKVTVVQGSVNNNPIVNAGTDVFIRLPNTSTTLNATASDIDGSVVSYTWSKQSGPAATLGATNSSGLSVTGLTQATYVFRVEVQDNAGSSATDEVNVVVAAAGTNNPPTVVAGGSKSITTPANSVILKGSASDSDGSIASLVWSQQNGPSSALLSGANSTTLTVQNLNIGLYTFRLTAKDNEDATAFSETTVEVKAERQPPVVFAGNDTTLLLPNNFIALKADVVEGDGFINEYVWTQTQGVSVEIKGEYPDVSLTQLLPGIYAFQLTVTDDIGVQASDEISIIVLEGKSNPLGASLFFSPNGDAVNDVWTIKNLVMTDGCPVAIFNGLGKKIYETNQYENNWDGTSNGQQVKEGDYYFVFECGTSKTYSGALRLIR